MSTFNMVFSNKIHEDCVNILSVVESQSCAKTRYKEKTIAILNDEGEDQKYQQQQQQQQQAKNNNDNNQINNSSKRENMHACK